jgi:DNA-binding transcriptional regulator YbjK
LALIRALKSFANPESVQILMQHYPHASWDERLEIIETLGGLDSIESLEFLSKVYNELQEYPELSKVQQNQMQERLAMALARRMMV